MSSLPTGTVTFFFSDIEGSTRLIQQLGERGLDVHRAARVASAGRGGQVLISDTPRGLADHALPPGLTLKDLGVHRLKHLARPERLFQLTVEGLPADFPPLKTLEATPNNLPTQLTSFIGRDDQVREAKHLLARSRLLTLTGPGGTGKTRLSLEIAAGVLDQFADGVYFVPLSAVHDPELVASAIAQALAISTTGSRRPIDALLDHLREKQTLLVLDNFEQVIKAAPIATQLLEGSAGLRVLVSSRTVLRVSGGQEFPVPPLALPDLKALPPLAALSQFEAVRLFIQRAIAVKPGFQAPHENAPAIAGICERVDGLPLAIELAAAPVKLFSPPALPGP